MSVSPGGASNAVVTPVVSYAPDPHGGTLFAALAATTGAALNGARAVVVGNPTWNGWTRKLQEMRGAAALGNARPYSVQNSELSRETTTTDVTTAAIFRSRMQRGRA